MTASIGWAMFAAGAMSGVLFLRRWRRELASLRRFLGEVIPEGRVRSREDLVRLQSALAERITFDPGEAHDARPLLRRRASDTLALGRGFCGENARAAVLLLRTGGVRAHRLYLFGERWGHVVAECLWEGEWTLFDAHRDPATMPGPDQLGSIPTSDVSRLPNRVSENPWLSAAALKPLRRMPALARLKPPGWLVWVMESPDLALAVLGGALAMAGLCIVAWG